MAAKQPFLFWKIADCALRNCKEIVRINYDS